MIFKEIFFLVRKHVKTQTCFLSKEFILNIDLFPLRLQEKTIDIRNYSSIQRVTSLNKLSKSKTEAHQNLGNRNETQ